MPFAFSGWVLWAPDVDKLHCALAGWTNYEVVFTLFYGFYHLY